MIFISLNNLGFGENKNNIHASRTKLTIESLIGNTGDISMENKIDKTIDVTLTYVYYSNLRAIPLNLNYLQ